jgi:hypothetical protein
MAWSSGLRLALAKLRRRRAAEPAPPEPAAQPPRVLVGFSDGTQLDVPPEHAVFGDLVETARRLAAIDPDEDR